MNYSNINAYVRCLLCHKPLFPVPVQFLGIRPLRVSFGIHHAHHCFEIFHDSDAPTHVFASVTNLVRRTTNLFFCLWTATTNVMKLYRQQ